MLAYLCFEQVMYFIGFKFKKVALSRAVLLKINQIHLFYSTLSHLALVLSLSKFKRCANWKRFKVH